LRYVCLAALLLGFSVQAAPSFGENQVLSRAAPSGTAVGVAISDVIAVQVEICAAAGQTLSGGGFLRAWVYLNSQPGAVGAGWVRVKDLDLTLAWPSGEAVKQCQLFWPVTSYFRSYRLILWATDSVTVSAGTTVDMLITTFTTTGV